MRARRLVAAASLAVGLVVLSGCRTEPGVAAYVGDHKITEDSVTRLIDELRPPAGAPSATPGQPQPEDRLPARSQVVSTLVLGEVCERLSDDKDYQPRTQLQAEQVSQQMGAPADAEYPKRLAELYTCLSGIPVGAPVAPTQQEMADLVAAGKKAGAIPPEVSVEEAAAQLDGQQLRSALASRKALADGVAGYDVTVNPRYRPLEFPVLSFQGDVAAVSVPLGEAGSDSVTDAR